MSIDITNHKGYIALNDICSYAQYEMISKFCKPVELIGCRHSKK